MADSLVEMVELPQGPTSVLWRRSPQARRLTLRIDPRAERVIVTLPLRSSRAAGLNFLRQHAGWVEAKLTALPPALTFADGAEISLGDQRLRIRHVPDRRGGAWFEGNEILVAGDFAFVPRRVRDLLRSEARTRLAATLAAIGCRTGLQARTLVVRDTSSRWGSCSSDRRIMLNWRLLLAPAAIQHYVIAHEIAHLQHMNHGPLFWALVAKIDPNYRAAVMWLKRHGPALMRAG